MKFNKIIIDGQVTNYSASDTGAVRNDTTSKFLSAACNGKGYLQVDLLGKKYFVHRLVAIAFLPMNGVQNEVNHKDGNPKNNNVDNLEWCTRAENMAHARGVLNRGVFGSQKHKDASVLVSTDRWITKPNKGITLHRIGHKPYRVTFAYAVGNHKTLGYFKHFEDAVACYVAEHVRVKGFAPSCVYDASLLDSKGQFFKKEKAIA